MKIDPSLMLLLCCAVSAGLGNFMEAKMPSGYIISMICILLALVFITENLCLKRGPVIVLFWRRARATLKKTN